MASLEEQQDSDLLPSLFQKDGSHINKRSKTGKFSSGKNSIPDYAVTNNVYQHQHNNSD